MDSMLPLMEYRTTARLNISSLRIRPPTCHHRIVIDHHEV